MKGYLEVSVSITTKSHGSHEIHSVSVNTILGRIRNVDHCS